MGGHREDNLKDENAAFEAYQQIAGLSELHLK
jgi:hypothetical protein